MALFGRLTLRKRIALFALTVLMTGLGLFSWLGLQSVNDSTERTLDERLTIARIAASQIDETLTRVLVQLQTIADLGEGIRTEEKFFSAASPLYELFAKTGIYAKNIFLIDKDGKVLMVEPKDPRIVGFDMSTYAEVSKTLGAGVSTVSGLVSSPLMEAPVVLISVPVFNGEGKNIGALTCSIDVAQSMTGAFSQNLVVGKTGYTEIVDGNGVVLARTSPGSPPKVFESSDHPGRFAELISQGKATVRTCHRCHGSEGDIQRREDILAFAPLSVASWGVAIRQSEEEALAPTWQLERSLLLFGIVLVVCTILLVLAMMRGIVEPIRMLTSAAKKVAAGNFDASIPIQRTDEIGQLSTAFQTMRQEIAKSRDEMMLRYREAKEKEELRGELLNSVISAQEEERKRIARELHDEYGQTLTGLIMSIESLENMTTPEQSQLKKKLADTKTLIIRTLESLRKLTLDLHPSSLDDLGLVAAVRTYIANNLQANGLSVKFESKGLSERLAPPVETALFRIIQEATNNIVKHAKARNIWIKLRAEDGRVAAIIEDDGQGFDVEAAFKTKARRSLGILSIQERTSLLGGTFALKSQVGRGTRLEIEIPIDNLSRKIESKAT